MTLLFAWAAVRRHPISIMCTVLLAAISASLLHAPFVGALLVWVVSSLLALEVWHALEPFVLRRLGCRAPTHLERDRLDPSLSARVEVLVLDSAEPRVGRGVRTLVVSRALLDLLEDRALQGLLNQAAGHVRSASVAGELIVWLGNLPLLGAWLFASWLAQLGRLLAVVVGAALLVPLLLWPQGFVRWGGTVFGSVIVACMGVALLASGFTAGGLGLLIAWAVVPALQALLAWEHRRAEAAADRVAIEAGFGWQLLEALETLTYAESLPTASGLIGLLCRVDTPFTSRADRLWKELARP